MLMIQLNYAERKLNEAIEKRVKKIVFIHGVGEGVLRSELRKVFDSYTQLSYHDASYSSYGIGATEVHLRYN